MKTNPVRVRKRKQSIMDSKTSKTKLPNYKSQQQLARNIRQPHFGKTAGIKDSTSNNEFEQSSIDQLDGESCFGSPVIVEALPQDVVSVRIPDVLQSSFEIKSHRMNNYCISRFKDDEGADRTIGQSINSSDNSNICPMLNVTTVTPVVQKKPTAKKRYRRATSKATSSNVGTSTQGAFEECVQDPNDCVMYNVEDTGQRCKQPLGNDSRQHSQCSARQRKLQFHTNGDSVILIMEGDSKFFFCGKLIVNVLYGVIEIDGAVVTSQDPPIKVYHPRDYCFSPLEVTGKHLQCDTDHIISLLLAEGIKPDFDTQTQEFQLSCSTARAVLKLQNFDNHLTKYLGNLYGVRVFPKVESSVYYHWTDPRKAEIALQCNFYFYDTDAGAPANYDPIVPPEITERIAYEWCTTGRSCTLLAGTKGVGKSAIARYLTNRLLPLSNKVIVVDLDIGQSEFMPSGCISYTLIDKPLLGPNFTHSNKPMYQLYIGHIDIMKCISQYIEGVKKLMDKLSRSTLANVPIVVNTMGFTQGIGWLLMIIVIKLVDPTNVLQIASKRTKKNFPKLLSSQNVNKENTTTISFRRSVLDRNKNCTHSVYMLQSQIEKLQKMENDAWKMQPYEKRDLMTVCYFSEVLKEKIELASQLDSAIAPAINEAVPYVVPLNSLCIAFSSSLVPPSQVLTVINGNIVALCSVYLNNHGVQQDQESRTVPTVLTRAPVSSCYGFGIVRGIDTDKGEIYITTPVPHSLIRYVNCLQGCHPVPDILLQLNLPNTPYTGGVNTLPTSREPRRGYFRMRYEKQRTSQ